ncbi:hypothetical protein [Bathymodiolus platifrons methanotrophic gill symbiont]|uniref:hypothetical protein n=1 Tax=Bathymodiolus platifrons methanotrophic gill symbiont TaxID=113268 RepID=UPI001C8D330A|nr:hypothetical protein [Bathymodiolus platifrons methanotrophic gill symbiont]
MATSNGSTAIRDKILASLARYRALRIGKFPCAFWRLSSRPGLTAKVVAKDGRTTIISAYTYSDAFQQATEFCGGALLYSMNEI